MPSAYLLARAPSIPLGRILQRAAKSCARTGGCSHLGPRRPRHGWCAVAGRGSQLRIWWSQSVRLDAQYLPPSVNNIPNWMDG